MSDAAPLPVILLAEDEFLIRMSVAETLADDGFEVLEAETLDEATSLLDSGKLLSLLITDMQLQRNGDGMRLARLARARFPALPVVYMTGRPPAPEDEPLGADETLVSKPFLPSEICALARRLLDRG